MKKFLFTIILMLTFISEANAKDIIRERNIDSFNTVSVNLPSRVIYHYSPFYSFYIKLEDDITLTPKDLEIKNKNGNLGIDIINLNDYELDELYKSSPENVIINIYAPSYPKIKTTSKDLWICENYKYNSTSNDKN